MKMPQQLTQWMSQGSNLRQRVITAAIGVALLLLLLIFGERPGVALIAAVVALGMMAEYTQIALNLSDKDEKRQLLLGITWLVAFANFWMPRMEFDLLIWVFLGLSSYFLFTATRYQESAVSLAAHFKEFIFSLFGMIYLAFMPLYLILIRDSGGGFHWMIVFFLIVWSSDTGAYFAGRKYGKTKLYPLISPKKTREGAYGALGAALLVTLIYKLLFFRAMSWFGALTIPVIVSAAAQVGDLVESFLKRAFDKKDSGSILPGHGGFLDRFDGVVFSAPVMYVLIRTLA